MQSVKNDILNRRSLIGLDDDDHHHYDEYALRSVGKYDYLRMDLSTEGKNTYSPTFGPTIGVVFFETKNSPMVSIGPIGEFGIVCVCRV